MRYLHQPYFLSCQGSEDADEKEAEKSESQRVRRSAVKRCLLHVMWLPRAHMCHVCPLHKILVCQDERGDGYALSWLCSHGTCWYLVFSFDGISTLIFLCSCEWPCSHVYTATLIGLSGSSKIKEKINNIRHGHSWGDRRGELKRSEMGSRNDHILLYSRMKFSE